MFTLSEDDPQKMLDALAQLAGEHFELAERQRAALAAAEGVARSGPVELAVGPDGSLSRVAIEGDVDRLSPAMLRNYLMEAYREAAQLANRACAASVVDPGASETIRRSMPEELAEEDGDDCALLPPGPERSYTLDDLPEDPEFERLLTRMDSSDAQEVLAELKAAAGLENFDFNRPAEQIQAEIIADAQRLARSAEEVGPELRALRVTHDTEHLTVTIGAWGQIHDLTIRPAALRLDAQQLAEAIVAGVREAEGVAAREARALLSASGIYDPQDPSLAVLEVRAAQ